MSARDVFGGNVPTYVLPATLGAPGEALVAPLAPVGGVTTLAWGTGGGAGVEVVDNTDGNLVVTEVGVTATVNLATAISVTSVGPVGGGTLVTVYGSQGVLLTSASLDVSSVEVHDGTGVTLSAASASVNSSLTLGTDGFLTAANTTLVLANMANPFPTVGTASQVLTSNGAGTVSWTTPSSAAPGYELVTSIPLVYFEEIGGLDTSTPPFTLNLYKSGPFYKFSVPTSTILVSSATIAAFTLRTAGSTTPLSAYTPVATNQVGFLNRSSLGTVNGAAVITISPSGSSFAADITSQFFTIGETVTLYGYVFDFEGPP